MSQVRIDFSARIEQVEQAMHRLEAENTKLIQKNRELAQQSRRGSNEATRYLGDQIGQVKNLVLGYLSLQNAIGLANKALEEQAKIRREAREFHVSIGDAQADMLMKAGKTTPAERDAIVAMADDLANKNAPEGGVKAVYEDLTAGISAGARGDQLRGIVDTAEGYLDHDQEGREQVIRALAALGSGKEKDATKNLGVLAKLHELSGAEGYEALGDQAKAINSLVAMGAKPEEAISLLGAVGRATGDTSGGSAKTTVKVLEQVMGAFPENTRYKTVRRGGREVEVVDAEGTGADDPLAALAAARAYPERAKVVAGELKARDPSERIAFKALMGLTPLGEELEQAGDTSASTAPQLLRENLRAVEGADLGREVTAQMEQINELFAQKLDEQERLHKRDIEALKDTAVGQRAAMEDEFSGEKIDELVRASGMGYSERTLTGWAAGLADLVPGGSSRQDVVLRTLQRRIEDLRYSNPRANDRAGPSAFAPPAEPLVVTSDPGRIEAADRLQKSLDRLVELTQQGNEQRAGSPDRRPPAQPAVNAAVAEPAPSL